VEGAGTALPENPATVADMKDPPRLTHPCRELPGVLRTRCLSEPQSRG